MEYDWFGWWHFCDQLDHNSRYDTVHCQAKALPEEAQKGIVGKNQGAGGAEGEAKRRENENQ